MPDQVISIRTPELGFAAVQQLYTDFMDLSELIAGKYCDFNSLANVIGRVPGSSKSLAHRLWRDTETIANWTTHRLSMVPGEHSKDLAVLGELHTNVRGLLTGITALRGSPALYDRLLRAYAGLSHGDAEEILDRQERAKRHRSVKRRATPVWPRSPVKIPASEREFSDFYRDRHPLREVLLGPFTWTWLDLDRIAVLETRLKNWNKACSSLDRALRRSHADAVSRKSQKQVGKRVTKPTDVWSKPAILLLACCWHQRLREEGIKPSRGRLGAVPHVNSFRTLVSTVLGRLNIPHVDDEKFTRQITEVLSGAFEVAASEIDSGL